MTAQAKAALVKNSCVIVKVTTGPVQLILDPIEVCLGLYQSHGVRLVAQSIIRPMIAHQHLLHKVSVQFTLTSSMVALIAS